jgi:hypothetical protein
VALWGLVLLVCQCLLKCSRFIRCRPPRAGDSTLCQIIITVRRIGCKLDHPAPATRHSHWVVERYLEMELMSRLYKSACMTQHTNRSK